MHKCIAEEYQALDLIFLSFQKNISILLLSFSANLSYVGLKEKHMTK